MMLLLLAAASSAMGDGEIGGSTEKERERGKEASIQTRVQSAVGWDGMGRE